MLNKSTIVGHLFTAKLPLRILAILGVLFLGGVATAFTYQAGGEIVTFFYSAKITSTLLAKRLLHLMAIFVGLATILQSFEMIWDKLSYWGQIIDNAIIRIFTGHKYFLDETDLCQYKIRKLLNETSCRFHQLNWQLIRKDSTYNIDISLSILNSLLNEDIARIFELLEKTLRLLKHNNIHDNINARRKYDADLAINHLVAQTSELSMQVIDLITELKEKNKNNIAHENSFSGK